MGSGKKHRKYDSQFKEEAVCLVTEGGRSVSEVAQSLGINRDRLYNWRQKATNDSSPDKPPPNSAEQELKRLQRENANLKEDKEILKKALAIFSKLPR
jgi:transposase-like protein